MGSGAAFGARKLTTAGVRADRARPGLGAAWLLAAVVCASAACEGPSVDARAVWIDESRDEEGRRTLHIYDQGEVSARKLARLGTDPPRVFLELGPAARSLLILGDPQVPGALWLDLEDGRSLDLPVPGLLPSDSAVEFLPRDDAVLWRAEGGLSFVPLAAGLEIERDEQGLVVPLRLEGQPFGWQRGAVGASRVFVFDQSARRLALVGYPSAPGEPLELRELASAEPLPLGGAGQDAVQTCRTGDLRGCRARAVVSPEGGSIAIVSDANGLLTGNCPLIRWAPGETGDLDCTGIEACQGSLECACIVDDVCPAIPSDLFGATLLTALDDETYVLLDAVGASLVRWRVGEESVERFPLLGGGPWAWAPVDGGRALSFVSQGGAMVRLDRERGLEFEAVSATETTCVALENRQPMFSPDGRWAAWSCASAADVSTAGTLLRVSGAGLERHDGIPMVPLAIDDQGDLLMFSEEITQEDPNGISATVPPRTLFTLSADGVLRRTDGLEPTPEPINLFEVEDARYIVAAPRQ